MSFDADIRQFPTPGALAAFLAALPRPSVWHPIGSTVHNTYRPTEAEWRGAVSMRSMMNGYIDKGWSAGPHFYLAAHAPNPKDDGIWMMTSPLHPGVHAGPCNDKRFGLEMVGDFQAHGWSLIQRALLLDTLDVLHSWAALDADINGHRDCMPLRTCPGNDAYAALPLLRADLAVRLSAPNVAVWNERWGSIAPPTPESWGWAAPQLWKANWLRLGKCISQALYDTPNGIYVQCFSGGDIRGVGGRWEVTFR